MSRNCLILISLFSSLGLGCQPAQRAHVEHRLGVGAFGQLRAVLRNKLTTDRSDRRYMLDRMRLALLRLADGYPRSAEIVLEDVYDVLRTQGINRDNTVAAVVINEDLKFWKGEPFEQAMAMFYYSVQQAMLGAWDNARAAAANSLFSLRDFGEDEQGQSLDTYAIARRALEYERAMARGDDPNLAKSNGENHGYLDHGYAVRESNFVLGYLMSALANQQLARHEEASDNFLRAEEIDAELAPLTAQLRKRRYNTILVVSYGLGPKKIAYGPDGALSRFQPRTETDQRPLLIQIDGQHTGVMPMVCDLNRMAADHMWNNLEDVRLAKSTLGNLLLVAGGTAAYYGHREDQDTTALVGVGLLASGLALKGGAHADTRYCDVMPQRVYIVPLQIDRLDTVIELQVEDDPVSRLLLAGLSPPKGQVAQLVYVRLLSEGYLTEPPAWATSGRIHYFNDQVDRSDGEVLPYILGGRCVRTPRPSVLSDYQRLGHLDDLTYNDLRELYRAEDISLTIEDTGGAAGLHVLEAGRSLVTPMVGTTGFARLFGQVHADYRPQSDAVMELFERYRRRHGATLAARGEPVPVGH